MLLLTRCYYLQHMSSWRNKKLLCEYPFLSAALIERETERQRDKQTERRKMTRRSKNEIMLFKIAIDQLHRSIPLQQDTVTRWPKSACSSAQYDQSPLRTDKNLRCFQTDSEQTGQGSRCLFLYKTYRLRDVTLFRSTFLHVGFLVKRGLLKTCHPEDTVTELGNHSLESYSDYISAI